MFVILAVDEARKFPYHTSTSLSIYCPYLLIEFVGAFLWAVLATHTSSVKWKALAVVEFEDRSFFKETFWVCQTHRIHVYTCMLYLPTSFFKATFWFPTWRSLKERKGNLLVQTRSLWRTWYIYHKHQPNAGIPVPWILRVKIPCEDRCFDPQHLMRRKKLPEKHQKNTMFNERIY